MSGGRRFRVRCPAKVNLSLRILGRRPDGYHEVDSLVVFAKAGETSDRVEIAEASSYSLSITGPEAGTLNGEDPEKNLITKALRKLAGLNGRPLNVAVTLHKNLPYDPVADFAPISLTAWGSLVLVANPAQKPNTLAEFVAAAKAAPKTINYGSPGVGTPHHLSMALVETASGIELVHVPYKGTAGAVQDLLGGQIGYMFLPVHVSAQHIRAGKLKAIAAGSPERLPQLPDVPTLGESGLKGVDVDMWYGLFAPKGTPADIVERLNREVGAILTAPEARAAFEAQGLMPTSSTPAATAARKPSMSVTA